jgi:branched-chain amino acid transport system ATP-binding protein
MSLPIAQGSLPPPEGEMQVSGKQPSASVIPQGAPLLQAKGIRIAYGGLRAVNDVDLTVRVGECLVMLGPNGAGKTSLMNAVAGTVTPLAGEITFDGESIRKLRTEQRVARGIALVPEGRRLFSSLTVAENLRLARASRRNKSFDQSMDLVQQTFPTLKERWNQSAATLSGGEQQMLAIGRALLTGPELLILDEPSIGLAPKIVREVYRRLAAVQEQGITLLVVEQNISALDLANQVLILRNGSIVSGGPPEKYRDADVLADAYIGSV